MLPTLHESRLIAAAKQGNDAFITLIRESLLDAIGGQLDANSLASLNGEQITLLAYLMLRDEVMEGGFIQLIHNGLGPFIFLNPFAKAIRQWGEGQETNTLHAFSKLVYQGRKLFEQYGDELTKPVTDDEFMALYEQFPDFDELDDYFVENEEAITAAIAHYTDEHLDAFITIDKN